MLSIQYILNNRIKELHAKVFEFRLRQIFEFIIIMYTWIYILLTYMFD